MNWKRCGRKWSWTNQATVPEFGNGTEENRENVRLTCVLADIRTQHLLNTSSELYRCANSLKLGLTNTE
jgi:hypothetical protein